MELEPITDWDRLAAGIDCPFEPPRTEPNGFWDTVARMSVSTLCLLKNQTYRGHCILIYDVRHAIRPDQLSPDEWARYCGDLHEAVRALMQVCTPDHINVECLGNQVPHLHWQVIPRYKSDPRWSGPIWTTTLEELHSKELSDDDRRGLVDALRSCLPPTSGGHEA